MNLVGQNGSEGPRDSGGSGVSSGNGGNRLVMLDGV
jgi:hypothetical protein